MKIQREQATADRGDLKWRLNMDGSLRKFFACMAAAAGLLFCATIFAQDEEISVISSAGAVTQVPPAVTTGVVNPALTFRDEAGNYQHITPTIQQLPSAVSATDSGPLKYHGGPVTGTTTYLANQSWNGHYYELQMMYDNHYRTCAQYGP
jgi:hypothetical protein